MKSRTALRLERGVHKLLRALYIYEWTLQVGKLLVFST
jgi:hypothetical protein